MGPLKCKWRRCEGKALQRQAADTFKRKCWHLLKLYKLYFEDILYLMRTSQSVTMSAVPYIPAFTLHFFLNYVSSV